MKAYALPHDGGTHDEISAASFNNAYYPSISPQIQFSETEFKDIPFSADFDDDGSFQNYYLYIVGDLPFYQDLPVGSWVAFNESIVAQVEDCQIDPLSSLGETPINSADTIYSHIPADLLVYTVESTPSSGELRLGGVPLNNGDTFSGQALEDEMLTYSGMGGSDSAKLSARGTYRISVNNDGSELTGPSDEPSISGDGIRVAFSSEATNVNGVFSDLNNASDIFIWNGSKINPISGFETSSGFVMSDGGSFHPNLKLDGSSVVFASGAQNLNALDSCPNNDVYRWVGSPLLSSTFLNQASCASRNTNSTRPKISEKGTVVFQTSGDLTGHVSGIIDTNSSFDTVINENGSLSLPKAFPTGLLGIFSTPNGGSLSPDISIDGNHVAFESDATNIVSNDTNENTDIFVRSKSDTAGISVRRMTLNSAGEEANSVSILPAISRFGEHVSFASAASNLAPNTDGSLFQVYVRDRNIDGDDNYDEADDSCTVLVSKSSSGTVGNDNSTSSSISADGRFIAFVSRSDNLVVGDLPTGSGGYTDIFVHDRDSDRDGSFYSPSTADDRCTPGPFRTFRVSVSSYGEAGNGNSFGTPDISANGQFVAFASSATNLVPNDAEGETDVFVHFLGYSTDLYFAEPDPMNHSPYRIYLPMIIR